MLVVPIILTAVPLAPEIYSAAFSLTGSPWVSAHFLVSKVMAAPGVDHQEALSGLALGLVTPRDLPRSNADGDVWLVPWLLLGFGWLRARLSRLEPS